jgi:transcriptional regulator GlxA family with amidase domain
MRRVVICGPPPVQILDVAGPLEVFSSAPGYNVAIGAPDGSHQLTTSSSISLTSEIPIDEVSGLIDTLVIAGGPGAENGCYDDVFLKWISETAGRSRRVASICTGAFVLAAAGLLDGKRAVTHWDFCDRLAREFPKVEVCPDPIFLRDGCIYTSAGMTAGIDLALALVNEDHGHKVALNVARQLVMFVVRPGGQAQYSHILSRQVMTSEPLQELQVWMLENLREDLTVEGLANRIGMSARNFVRVCQREMGMNPGQFVDGMRVEAAQRMIESTSMGLKEVADACGFNSVDSMRKTFLRKIGTTAGKYAALFRRRVHS